VSFLRKRSIGPKYNHILKRRIKMTDFIAKLEDMLKMSGYEDWEIRYFPQEKAYVLKLDGDVIFMRKVTGKENNNAEN